jgi:hypothetical protein
MFDAIRTRINATTVLAGLALVFAMTGGAYAAKKYLITSTKQISPSVLKSLQGKAGPVGAPGAAGAQGAQGAQGPAGAAGAKGETGGQGAQGEKGEKGTTGAAGAKGAMGATGATGFTETLPSGKTETGSWVMRNGSGGAAALEFNIPLAAPFEGGGNVQYNREGFPTGASAGEKENCPGTAAEPKAKKGFLCVYTGWGEFIGGATSIQKVDTNGLSEVSTSGAVLVTTGTVEGEIRGIVTGTWAVTAP